MNALIVGISIAYDRLAPLPHAADEVRTVAELFKTLPVMDFDATAYQVQQRCGNANYIHLACHGYFAWERGPLESAIYLANDKPVSLSKIISDFKLEKARLVTLSGCETGISDISNASPDEYVGFPAGFMQAGAAAVVSSLWTVDDQSTKLLMQKFYELHIHEKVEPSVALRRAQCWLRDADVDQLRSVGSSISRSNVEGYNQAMEQFFADNKSHPYANPYFWAAFTFTGA